MPRQTKFLVLLLLLCSTVTAQTAEKPAAQPNTPAKTAAAKKPSAADRSRIAQQKAMALSILLTLANDAGSYPDQTLRARTLSRIADALWEADPEQGRSLFRKAWDAAVVADQEAQRRVEEDRRQQESSGRGFAIAMPPDLRSEILRLVARRDRAMGEELLDKLTEARKQEADAAANARRETLQTPEALRQRLRLANQLLETDVERALQFAEPGLATITMEGVSFLTNLRSRDAAAADQRYRRFLAMAASDLQADANTVSLLSSYLFTPHLYVMFNPDGGQESSQMNRRTDPPQVAPELRNAFFSTAARVLLRPSPAREQDRSTTGSQGKYLVIRRLLPLFEQHAPKEITEQLRAEMASLAQTTNADIRNREDDSITRGITPDRKPEDVEKSLLDRIENAKTSQDRDSLYLQLAMRTAEKGDMRARDFVDKIDDIEIRKQAKPYVDMTLAISTVDRKDVDQAMFLAANGELTHIQRVWLLTQTAKQMPPAEREKALEILAEALVEARRIGGSEADRPRAMVAVTNAYLVVDRARAWDTMLDAVKASNSAETFTGEDGRIMMRLRTPFATSLRTNSVEDFNLQGVFRAFAQENATQAIEMARSFEREAPRATALIAVARSLLTDKKR